MELHLNGFRGKEGEREGGAGVGGERREGRWGGVNRGWAHWRASYLAYQQAIHARDQNRQDQILVKCSFYTAIIFAYI